MKKRARKKSVERDILDPVVRRKITSLTIALVVVAVLVIQIDLAMHDDIVGRATDDTKTTTTTEEAKTDSGLTGLVKDITQTVSSILGGYESATTTKEGTTTGDSGTDVTGSSSSSSSSSGSGEEIGTSDSLGDSSSDPPVSPSPPICGDGVVDSGEECDDGNTNNDDGCSAKCEIEVAAPPSKPVCGNGIVETGEQCDDGNTVGSDGCSATCQNEILAPNPGSAVCGNDIIEGDEACDGQEGCLDTCEYAQCSDGIDNDGDGDIDENDNNCLIDGIFHDALDNWEGPDETDPEDTGGVTDGDQDGIPDNEDNCPNDANPQQTDTDNDGLGDECDDDDDNDEVLDVNDNCPLARNTGQGDLDGDLIGDVCDPDKDGDGVLNEDDNCPLTPNANQDETACYNNDYDFDGILDVDDNCPQTPNGPSTGVCTEVAGVANPSGGDNTFVTPPFQAVVNDFDECGPDNSFSCPEPGQICEVDHRDYDSDGIGDVCDECPFDEGNQPNGCFVPIELNCPAGEVPNAANTECIPDTTGSSSSGGSSSGSSSGGGPSQSPNAPIVINPGNVFLDGQYADVRVKSGREVHFTKRSSSETEAHGHIITVTDVFPNENRAVGIIESEPQNFELTVGEINAFDLSEPFDGIMDLALILEGFDLNPITNEYEALITAVSLDSSGATDNSPDAIENQVQNSVTSGNTADVDESGVQTSPFYSIAYLAVIVVLAGAMVYAVVNYLLKRRKKAAYLAGNHPYLQEAAVQEETIEFTE